MKPYLTVWVTDWGTLHVTEEEIAEAGLWERKYKYKRRTFPRKNTAILHDILTLYAMDRLDEMELF